MKKTIAIFSMLIALGFVVGCPVKEAAPTDNTPTTETTAPIDETAGTDGTTTTDSSAAEPTAE